MLASTLSMAVREIRRNVMRSVLTALGIVIGVAAVILMVTLGQSATLKITGDIANLGNNLLIVMPGSERRGPTAVSAAALTSDDARAIVEQVPAAGAVAPSVNRGALAVFGNTNYNTIVTGSTNAYLDVRLYKLGAGRAFSSVELVGGSPVCVLGATVRRELFHAQDPLGASIRVGRLACKVVGVLASKGAATFGGDQDDFILMPLIAVQRRITGSTDLSAIFVSAINDRATSRAKQQIVELLRERRRVGVGQADDFAVQDMKEITDTLGTVTGVLTALLGAIAAVSLLVGGIGIMNIMLVSVTERTREIGVRMAIGAKGGDIRAQFLVEAVVLAVTGGVLGIALGVGIQRAVAYYAHWPVLVSSDSVSLAFVFSALIGVTFGFYPALKASRLDPIEALRYE